MYKSKQLNEKTDNVVSKEADAYYIYREFNFCRFNNENQCTAVYATIGCRHCMLR